MSHAGMTGFRTRVPRGVAAAVALAAAAALAGPSEAITHLKRGMDPPPISLEDLAGETRTLREMKGRPVVLLFGELYHDRTRAACEALSEPLSSDRLADRDVAVVLVVAQRADREQLREQARDLPLARTVLRDVERRAYGDYRVAVMPSAVVIDAEGRVVHAVAGYTARFADIVTDALLMATGQLSEEQFERSLRPGEGPGEKDAVVRAARIAGLARQLFRRGLREMAEQKYREAIEVSAEFVPAHLGLGTLLLQDRRLAEAEREFRLVLEGDPGSLEAALGLAYLQAIRGGEELEEAESSVRRVISRHPGEPRAHYLLGLIHDQRARPDEAAASYRRATELLMTRIHAWDVVPGEPTDVPE